MVIAAVREELAHYDDGAITTYIQFGNFQESTYAVEIQDDQENLVAPTLFPPSAAAKTILSRTAQFISPQR